ncbi:MAG: RNA 2',3'-cyclic phosphodiesterase [Candidatus Margulisiibacteriota bacterium]
MRFFIAITLPEKVKLHIARFQKELRSPFLIGNWVRHDNFHITLKFLGNISDEEILNRIESNLHDLALTLQPFNLTLSEIGVFPNLSAPGVIWVGTRSVLLTDLSHQLDKEMEPFGFKQEKHDFVGHVTLARLKRGKIKPSWFEEKAAHFKTLEISVKKITLYQSTLTDKDPVYKVVKHFRFDRSD